MYDPEEENQIRRIVREELRALLDSLGRTASTMERLSSSDMEAAAMQAIETAVKSEAFHLPHAWDCSTRNPRLWQAACSCGVVPNPVVVHKNDCDKAIKGVLECTCGAEAKT